jgi:hypothetical protein
MYYAGGAPAVGDPMDERLVTKGFVRFAPVKDRDRVRNPDALDHREISDMRTLVLAGVALAALGSSLSPASAFGPISPYWFLGPTIASCSNNDDSYAVQCGNNVSGAPHSYSGGPSMANTTHHHNQQTNGHQSITQDATVTVHAKKWEDPSRKVLQIGYNNDQGGSSDTTQTINQTATYTENHHTQDGTAITQVGVNENYGGSGNEQHITQNATVTVIVDDHHGGYGGGGCGGEGGGGGQGYCGPTE